MRVLITGASGLLGLNACLMQASRHDVVGVTHNTGLQETPFKIIQADLTAEGAIEELIKQTQPDILFNCAAMAQVDQCETYPDRADRINAWMPGVAAEQCKIHDISFVHISTDAVFDGKSGGYGESDTPHPLSVYGRTKLKGEERVQAANPSALVARVNFFGHSLSGNRSLAEFFLNNLLAGKQVNGFTDVIFSPLYVRHLVSIIFAMLAQGLHGIYHVVGEDRVSKYEFGRMIANKLSLNENLIKPTSVEDAGLKAQRSPNLFLDISKLKDSGITIPSLEQGLDDFIHDYQENWPEKIRAYQS